MRATLLTCAAAALVGGVLVATPAEAATRHIALTRWTSTAELAKGTTSGTKVGSGAITIAKPVGHKTYKRKAYDYARWTSPWASAGFGANRIIPSWNATTPKGTWIKVQVRGHTTTGKTGGWDTIAYWASGDSPVKRTSLKKQSDDYSSVDTDTVTLDSSYRYAKWQTRVMLLRPKGTSRTPKVDSVGAVASALPSKAPATSKTSMTRTIDLKTPGYSQMIHRGEYPKWDNGGEAWCSPTSTMTVLRYFKSGPGKKSYAWVKKSYKDRFVDHAARYTYDYRYQGTGNWPFNTAYAGIFGKDAFVTRLADLRDAERFVKAGIPVVVSISFKKGQLKGAPISSTNGHLLVIRGFAKDGRVIAGDPAGPSDAKTRYVYNRAQFERAWLHGSSGTAYVIHPKGKALPKRPAGAHRW